MGLTPSLVAQKPKYSMSVCRNNNFSILHLSPFHFSLLYVDSRFCTWSIQSPLPKSTMVVVDCSKSQSSALMRCLDNFKSNPSYVNRYRPKTILYLLLLDLSTWNFHVTTFFALIAGKEKSTLTIRLLVIFPACVCHFIRASFYGDIFLLVSSLQLWNYIYCLIRCENFKLCFIFFGFHTSM